MPCTLVNETCPAAVTNVTLITNSFNLGAGDVQWVHDVVIPDADMAVLQVGSTQLTLGALPAANTLKVYQNGQQIEVTLNDLVVTLPAACRAADVFVVDYLPQPAV